jgi:hypothetical protein
MQDLLRQEAQREADVQELDEQVRREEERVQQVTMLAWPDMRLQAHSLALHDCVRLQAQEEQRIREVNGEGTARGNPCSDSAAFAARTADPHDHLGERHSVGHLGQGATCQSCGALTWPGERMSCCGAHRSVVLPAEHTIPEPPDVIRAIMDPAFANYDADLGRVWRDHSRAINSCLAFASSQVREAHLPGGRGAPPHFSVNGAIQHNIGPLRPNEGTRSRSFSTSMRVATQPNLSAGYEPRFAQMYFWGEDEAEVVFRRQQWVHLHQRGRNVSLRDVDHSARLIAQLEALIRAQHPFYAVARQTLDVWAEQPEEQRVSARVMLLHSDGRVRGDFQGSWDNPHGDAVAGLVPHEGTSAPRQLYIYSLPRENHAGDMQRLWRGDGLADPLCYPTFFPAGTLGYSSHLSHAPIRAQNLQAARDARRNVHADHLRNEIGEHAPRQSRDSISVMEYYRHRLQVRDAPGPEGVLRHDVMHRGYRLFEQYVIDAWLTVEDDRLQWMRTHQDEIRADLYQGLADAVAEGEAATAGVRVVLPSTHSHSPRNLMQRFQDAMAITRAHGRPHLFITMTCNPEWPEILQALCPGQTARDRSDVVSRVFYLKQKELIHDIMEGKVLGDSVAYVKCIEYQKRGLPHLHLVVWLQRDIQLEDVDNVICCEIPDPAEHPELYRIVMKQMIHTCRDSCDPDHRGTPEEPYCNNHFPAEFTPHTYLDERGFLKPRRRHPSEPGGREGRTTAGATVGNDRVVPYNPYLLLKYDCHLNVLIATSVSCIGYLFKYLHKGGSNAAYYLQATSLSVFHGLLQHFCVRRSGCVRPNQEV